MVSRKRAKIMAILYFLFISFCFGISAIFAPSIKKKLYNFEIEGANMAEMRKQNKIK